MMILLEEETCDPIKLPYVEFPLCFFFKLGLQIAAVSSGKFEICQKIWSNIGIVLDSRT